METIKSNPARLWLAKITLLRVIITWWTFRIFFIFFSAQGREKGESEAPGGGGDRFFIENPRRGGGFQEWEGPGGFSAANWGIWGGGLNIFFRGRNVHQD